MQPQNPREQHRPEDDSVLRLASQRDPRLDHVKFCIVPIKWLFMLLHADGGQVPKVEGWPALEEGVQIIGSNMMETSRGLALMLTLYHPDFPIVLQQPPMMPLSIDWRSMPDAFEWDDLLPMLKAEDAPGE